MITRKWNTVLWAMRIAAPIMLLLSCLVYHFATLYGMRFTADLACVLIMANLFLTFFEWFVFKLR